MIKCCVCRHSRAFCNAQRDRLYKKDGKIVARNRHSRPEQDGISLAEYRSELIDKVGKAAAAKDISPMNWRTFPFIIIKKRRDKK